MLSVAPAVSLVLASGILVQGWSEDHPGFDYACRVGTPVYALVDGTMYTDYNGRMGNTVTIKGQGKTIYYAHLDTTEAQGPVKKGDIIGTCGNTGSWSTGPHLHLEVK